MVVEVLSVKPKEKRISPSKAGMPQETPESGKQRHKWVDPPIVTQPSTAKVAKRNSNRLSIARFQTPGSFEERRG